MKQSVLSVLLLAFTSSVLWADEPAARTPLFNGEDLSGWQVPDDNPWWSVQDGMLVCQSDPKRRASTLWTERQFADFEVQTEFRFSGNIDSGIFLRTESQQVQIGVSRSLKRDMTGSIYVSGKGYPGKATGVQELLKDGKWNQLRVEVRGPQYTVWLNGTNVLRYQADKAPTRGPIGLQLHGGVDMRIDFRNLRVAELGDG